MISKLIGLALSVWMAYVLVLMAIEVDSPGTGWFVLCAGWAILSVVGMGRVVFEEWETIRVNKAKNKANYERVFLTDFQKSLED